MSELVVVALGGNALIRSPQAQDIPSQYMASVQTCQQIVELLQQGYRVAITHGNGPQVGFILRRSELSRGELHELPLDVAVADTQGSIGAIFQRVLLNLTADWSAPPHFTTVLTHVEVDPDDPDFANPSKPVGNFITDRKRAEALQQENGWLMFHDPIRGSRRVVPSPIPKKIIELPIIKKLITDGHCVIACGGGGIPVKSDSSGMLSSVEAVIDKDRTSCLLAQQIGASRLFIATNVERACVHFDTPEQEELGHITTSQARAYLNQNEFGRGSMAPKIEAAIQFVESGGTEAVLGHLDQLSQFSNPNVGTRISKG